MSEFDGLLITGVYGSGKSSLAAEIGETLERRGVSYAAIDLDWLAWFHVPGLDDVALRDVHLANVAAVVANVRAAGVRQLVLAGAVRDRGEVQALEQAAGTALRVVRLEVPIDEIVRRLESDPTSGRQDDLSVAREWIANSIGVGVEERVVRSDGPIQDVACELIDWLGWAHN